MLKHLILSGCSLEIYQGLLLTFHTNNLRLKDNKFHSGLDSTSRSRILVPLIMLFAIRQSLTQNLLTWATMKRCADMCQKVGQPFSIQTFDLQLYAVAQQVKWDRPSEFKSHILRLGGFHTLSCFISSIGKIWGDGGLRDLLVDSGVYAAATVDQMLAGKQFNRAVRGLTLLYETLKTLWICSFFDWIRQQKCLEIPESLL
ncbi:unnamed protein product [Mytilus edulis]|uniref:Uncharacterized protein n=1 Tax=Mytilus edulis TaxID=6550 RepID=A0A8S3QMU8_MYTED|nr:unnamed protein product [Mytilus edulis]